MRQTSNSAAGDMPGSVRVACASNTGDLLDGHFGSCAWFFIYQISPDEIRLVDVRTGPGTSGVEDTTAHGDKTARRVELVRDCHVLYVASIGGPAAARVVNAGVHPVKLSQGGAIAEFIGQLQRVLAGTPPPWLAKVMSGE